MTNKYKNKLLSITLPADVELQAQVPLAKRLVNSRARIAIKWLYTISDIMKANQDTT